MHRPRKLVSLVLICVAGMALAAVAIAGVTGPPRGTRIISPPGGLPTSDGPSDDLAYTFDGNHGSSMVDRTDPIVGTPRPMDNLEFSQDNRQVWFAAYSSKAGMAGTTADGHSHIYLFVRKRHQHTTAGLLSGMLVRIDPNMGGDSVKPSLDGQTITGDNASKPNCVVFQSTSDLTNEGTNGKWVIYLYKINSRKITRVSPPGDDAHDPVVNGLCTTVTFEQGGTVYVKLLGSTQAPQPIAAGFNPDQQTDGKGVAYDRADANGVGQVFYTPYTYKNGTFKKGTEVTVSVAAPGMGGGDGNGDSSMPSVNDNGAYVAFESKADNLCDGSKEWCGTKDANGHITDVFRRTVKRIAPTPDQMEMISFDGKKGFQSDLDSDQVKITGAGEQACFRSFGVQTHDNKFRKDGHTGPFEHIYFWNFPREKMIGAFSGESKEGVTSTTELQRADGSAAYSWSCAISNRGNFIGFSSDTEHMAGDQNGHTTDMFLRWMGGSDEGRKAVG